MKIDPRFADLAHLVDLQLGVFPTHAAYLTKRFASCTDDELALADDVARMVMTVAGDNLAACCADYAWLSPILLEEELYFRRHGRYRLSSFEEALATVYSQREFMSRYMNGLLLSQVWWKNHTTVMGFYRDVFLAGARPGFDHLEVGPGHGLLLAMAASSEHCGAVEGWDVSAASLANTAEALTAIGVPSDKISLKEVDIFDGPDVTFDTIVLSEVLEHLEEPLRALQVLFQRVRPGGRIFINAPVNSPAPDHIFLFSTPEAIVELVKDAGFQIEHTCSLRAPAQRWNARAECN